MRKGKRGELELTKSGILHHNINAKIPVDGDFEGLDEILYREAVETSLALEKYPDLRKLSKRNQLILVGSAMGMGQRAIGSAVGLSAMQVGRLLSDIDPDQMIRMTDEGRQTFVASIVASRTLDALLCITTEKLEGSSARDLSVIAKNLTSISDVARNQKQLGSSSGQLETLMGEMEHMEMADVEELGEVKKGIKA